MRKHAAPIIAVVLLLMPVLYVGSYFALVEPGPAFYVENSAMNEKPSRFTGYRVSPSVCEIIFWPLEQIDRKVRPGAWSSDWDMGSRLENK